jgi:hypothetical protein
MPLLALIALLSMNLPRCHPLWIAAARRGSAKQASDATPYIAEPSTTVYLPALKYKHTLPIPTTNVNSKLCKFPNFFDCLGFFSDRLFKPIEPL